MPTWMIDIEVEENIDAKSTYSSLHRPAGRGSVKRLLAGRVYPGSFGTRYVTHPSYLSSWSGSEHHICPTTSGRSPIENSVGHELSQSIGAGCRI